MLEQVEITTYLQRILSFLIISIPPWFALVSKMKNKKSDEQKKFLIIALIIYLSISSFTNNILPTIVSIIYLVFTYNKKKDLERIYLRPLKKEEYTVKFKGFEKTIKFSKEGLNIILQSIIFKVLATTISFWFIVFLTSKGIEVENQDIVGEFLNASTLKAIYLSFLIVITAPILEEFIFRHLFYRIIKKKTGKIFSAVLTSVLFAMFHYYTAGVMVFLLIGIFNCYLYEKHGIRAPIINHFIFNFTSLIYMIYMKSII